MSLFDSIESCERKMLYSFVPLEGVLLYFETIVNGYHVHMCGLSCSNGCNAHFDDGYHYIKQMYELNLKLSRLNDRQLDKISRLCSDLSVPRPWIFIVSNSILSTTS